MYIYVVCWTSTQTVLIPTMQRFNVGLGHPERAASHSGAYSPPVLRPNATPASINADGSPKSGVTPPLPPSLAYAHGASHPQSNGSLSLSPLANSGQRQSGQNSGFRVAVSVGPPVAGTGTGTGTLPNRSVSAVILMNYC